MKSPLIATMLLALAAVISSANATSPTCTPECPFFRAWALTKVCRNLSFNEAGRYMVKVKTLDHGIGSESRKILRQEMPWAKHFVGYNFKIVTDPNACSQCQAYNEERDNETGGSSPCRYLQSSDWPKPWLSAGHFTG